MDQLGSCDVRTVSHNGELVSIIIIAHFHLFNSKNQAKVGYRRGSLSRSSVIRNQDSYISSIRLHELTLSNLVYVLV